MSRPCLYARYEGYLTTTVDRLARALKSSTGDDFSFDPVAMGVGRSARRPSPCAGTDNAPWEGIPRMANGKRSSSDSTHPVHFPLSRRAVLGGTAGALTLSAAGVAQALASATTTAGELGIETPLFKVTEFVTKRPELSKDAFVQHWRDTRAPLVRALPGLVKVNFFAVDKSPEADLWPSGLPYDAAIQTYYKDEAAYHRALDSDPALTAKLHADTEKWIQDDFLGLVTKEVVLYDLTAGGPPPAVRRVGMAYRLHDTIQPEFFHLWRTKIAGDILALKLPKLRYYAINLVRRDQFPSSRWDGYLELAWDNLEDMKAAAEAPGVRAPHWKRIVFTGAAEH